VLGVPCLHAQDYGNDKPPPIPEVAVPLTPEEKTLLAAVDVRLAAVERIAEKVDDPAYKSSVNAAIADLKKRRAALEKKFDPASYETLMHNVIGRYQVIALWLTPPRTLPPASQANAAAGKPEAKPGS
jgi:hypothetical protein